MMPARCIRQVMKNSPAMNSTHLIVCQGSGTLSSKASKPKVMSSITASVSSPRMMPRPIRHACHDLREEAKVKSKLATAFPELISSQAAVPGALECRPPKIPCEARPLILGDAGHTPNMK